MRKTLFVAAASLLGVASPAAGQTPFEQLFDPRTATTIVVDMSEATWGALAAELPAGGVCNFGADPAVPRYSWHKADATVITEGVTRTEQFYPQIGIKKSRSAAPSTSPSRRCH